METDWLVATDPADSEAEIKKLRRKKTGRQFPWERGPIAWEVAGRANEILNRLANHPRKFFSLRQTAKLFGVSTQPVRDWVRRDRLKRDGPRQQFEKDELRRFLNRLVKKAEPFDSEELIDRIHRKTGYPSQFRKLRKARFIWPKEKEALSPREIASLVDCHPSLVLLAIKCKRVRARPRSRCRNEITKRAWRTAFFWF